MPRAERLCMFYHRVGGRKGCVRPECRFIHSIEDRVNMLLDSPDDAACAEKITALISLAGSARAVAKEIAAQEPPTPGDAGSAVLYDDNSHEPPSDPAPESAIQTFCDAVTRMRIDIAATAVVVEAVAATQDSTCPGLRDSLLEELQRLFSDPAGDAFIIAAPKEHLSVPDSVSPRRKSVVFPHRALEAFEKRRLMEEQVGGR